MKKVHLIHIFIYIFNNLQRAKKGRFSLSEAGRRRITVYFPAARRLQIDSRGITSIETDYQEILANPARARSAQRGIDFNLGVSRLLVFQCDHSNDGRLWRYLAQ